MAKRWIMSLFLIFSLPSTFAAKTWNEWESAAKPLEESRNWKAAAALWLEAVKDLQDDKWVRVHLLWTLREAKNWTDLSRWAADTCKNFSAEKEPMEQAYWAWLNLFWAYRQTGNTNEARNAAEMTARLNAEEPNGRLVRGWAAIDHEQWDTALLELRPALLSGASNEVKIAQATVYARRADALLRSGDTNGYVRDASEAWKTLETDWTANYRGNALREAGRPAEAAAFFLAAMTRWPDYPWYRQNRAWCLSQEATRLLTAGDTNGWLNQNKAAWECTNLDWTANNLGYSLRVAGKAEEARSLLVSVTNRFPQLWIYDNLAAADAAVGDIELAKGKTNGSHRWYADAWKTSEKDWTANALGVSFIRNGRPEEAATLLKNALERWPGTIWLADTYAWACAEAGNLALSNGRLSDSHAWFSKAYASAKKAWIQNLYALSAARMGDYDLAIRMFEDGLRNWPDYEWFSGNLAWVASEAANRALERGETNQALEYSLKASRTKPFRPWTVFTFYSLASRLPSSDPGRGEIVAAKSACLASLRNATNDSMRRESLSALDFLVIGDLDRGLFETVTNTIQQLLPDNPWGVCWTGRVDFILAQHEGVKNQAWFDRAIAENRRGMELFEKQNPGRPYLSNLTFPLGGTNRVTGRFDDPSAATHTGFGKYCYDFMTVWPDDSLIKNGKGSLSNPDYAVFGQPVYAMAEGTVSYVSDSWADNPPGISDPAHGNSIEITNREGVKFWYAHLKQRSAKIRKGDAVRAGDQLAEAGNSGYSWAPHLHVSVVDANGVSLPFDFGHREAIALGMKTNLNGFLEKGVEIFNHSKATVK